MFRHLLITVLVLMPASIIAGDEPVLELDQYRGQVVYLDFWASWCVPCRRSFPWMNEMHSRYSGDGLVILAVNVDAERQDAEQFLEALPADFRVIFDPEGRLAEEWQLLGMPNSFLISRNGEVVARHVGFRSDTPGKLETEIREQLRAGKTRIGEVAQ